MKKILSFILAIISIFTFCSCGSNETYDVVSTCFIGYDISKEIAPELKSSMLLKPGEDLHEYSPTVNDIEKIINSKLFIYIGGESDEEFVENDILKEIDKNKTKVINLMDVVSNNGDVYNEEDPESYVEDDEHEHDHEEEEEYDEHIWTSIGNVKVIAEEIYKVVDTITGTSHLTNYNEFVSKLDILKNDFTNAINNSSKKPLIFADRFPLLYFVKEFNLEYDAAFKGCESSKEANPKTIINLTKKVIDNNIDTIFVIELSEAKIADTIVSECKKQGKNVIVRTFYTMHNISKKDYKEGKTYLDLMHMNLDSLKLALD